jgi:uncharacterized protein YraI
MKLLTATALLFAIALPAIAQVEPAESKGYTGVGTVCTAERGSNLSVRSGSGKNYRVLTQIRDRSGIQINDIQYGKDGFQWLLTSANGLRGWVRADYICGLAYDKN